MWESVEKAKLDLLRWLQDKQTEVAALQVKPAKLHVEPAQQDVQVTWASRGPHLFWKRQLPLTTLTLLLRVVRTRDCSCFAFWAFETTRWPSGHLSLKP